MELLQVTSWHYKGQKIQPKKYSSVAEKRKKFLSVYK